MAVLTADVPSVSRMAAGMNTAAQMSVRLLANSIPASKKETIFPFVSESEMIDYINDIGGYFYGN